MDPDKSALKLKPISPLIYAVYPLAGVFLMILAGFMVDGSRVCVFNPVAYLSSVGVGKAIMNPLYITSDVLDIARNFTKEGKREGRFVLHYIVQHLSSSTLLQTPLQRSLHPLSFPRGDVRGIVE